MTIKNNQKICDACGKDIKFSEYCLFHFNKQRHFHDKKCFLEWVTKYIDFLNFDDEENKK